MKRLDNKAVWAIFLSGLICLLFLQGGWLYYTYGIKLKETTDIINNSFIESVQKELDYRFLLMDSKTSTASLNDTLTVGSFEIQGDNVGQNGMMSQQFMFMQQMMNIQKYPFSISVLDSIFSSALKVKEQNVDYVLLYRDSTGIIQSTGLFRKGFETDPIPIVNGSEVQAIVNIPLPAVFKHMIWILVASALMLFLIIGCLAYELRVIFTQRHLTRLRDDFTHALTHDMKTPLGTIYMVMDQWRKGVLDNHIEMRTKFCEIAIEQVLNMQALVDKILTIARLEQDRLVLETQTIDLPDMIQGLVDKFAVQGGKPVGFRTNFDLQNSIICADPTYLKNAISNLIDNAIKYSESSVNIELDAYTRAGRLYIKVKDDGLGVSFKDQQKIFDKFERGEAVKRKGAKGFGLGLNYVKRVAEAHGGTIAVSSIEGHGSEFVVVIPLIVSAIE